MLVLKVLGTIGVERDGEDMALTSPKQRLLLALLAASQGSVGRDRLVDALWGDEPPDSAAATLMGYVSRLRAALGADAVVGRPEGYALDVDLIDAHHFEAVIAGEAAEAELEDALAQWRGEPFGEFSEHPFLVGASARLRELRTSARLRLASAYLERGDTARPISMLEAVVADEPVREDAWVLLARALLEAGRPADAVRTANRCRRQLADIGLDPSAELVAVEAAALQQRSGSPAAPARAAVGPVRYCRNEGVHLAYQIVGSGPVDVVVSSYGTISIDAIWDDERFSSFVTRLARSCRVILYDTRGVGLSDPVDVTAPPALEVQSDDLLTVITAAGARRAVVVGVGDGGPVAIAFAHRHSGHLDGLVLVNTFARIIEAPGYRGISRQQFDANLEISLDAARDTSDVLRNHAPSVADDAAFGRWWERSSRRGASPATANALAKARFGADVRSLLPQLTVPTLVLHRRGSRVVPMRFGAYLAAEIPEASFIELDGADQPPFTEGAADIADAIAAFATDLGASATGIVQ